jgi:hypothetical protein
MVVGPEVVHLEDPLEVPKEVAAEVDLEAVVAEH